MKRNRFTTFIFNLAIADFGYLASICFYFAHMMYINANFLLTAISIDRCMAVLFPLWHRCSRPKHLSSGVCAFLWISSFLLGGILNIVKSFGNYNLFIVYFLVAAIVCLPLIMLSTGILFIKVCLKSNQKNKSRLLLMILITLLCYLILGFPLNVIVVIVKFSDTADGKIEYWLLCTMLFSYLNSSINPVIYFLVGRKKGAQSKESVKVLLQKVFKEGEATRER
ncbi:Mrgprh: Mas-related G-protein coupled receptor member H [Crotalus adamanteus]|uniref:Mrgprh: Mas-related G-protein coupled receptor member H n=1 Tax=Crotalus adamanteus TaxID=8729 RepID=A0AAW1BLZ9_CROAD